MPVTDKDKVELPASKNTPRVTDKDKVDAKDKKDTPKPKSVPVLPVSKVPARKPAKKKPIKFNITHDLFKSLDSDTQEFLQELADEAENNRSIRILYNPKVTTGKAVYRTIYPYSLRLRNIHVDGKFPKNYEKQSKPTIVLFGYDPYKKTIKMFVVDRITQYEFQGKKFTPKWPVEFGDIGVKESLDDVLSGSMLAEEYVAELEFLKESDLNEVR